MNTQTSARASSTGLFRERLAGPGATVRAAFAKLHDSAPAGQRYGLVRSGDSLMAYLPYWAGTGGWDLYQVSGGLFAVVTHCDFSRPHSEQAIAEGLVEFHLSLNGVVQLAQPGRTRAVRELTSLICQQRPGESYTIQCGPGRRSGISLYVEPGFLRDSLDLAGIAPAHTLANASVTQRVALSCQAADLARQLIGNSFAGRRRLFFAKSLFMQLLCAFSTAWERRPLSTPCDGLTLRDLELFERARQRVIETALAPLTIATLARELGTNATKLKSGFKRLYGTTIWGLGSHQRLTEAMRLLTGGSVPVGQVARQVGYRNQASFSCAFKRTFGINPKDARRFS